MTDPGRNPHADAKAAAEPGRTPTFSEGAEPGATGAWQQASAEADLHGQATTPYQTSSTTGPVRASGSFGRYELLGEAKAGGMGVVYKARDTALDRVVALKTLKTGTVAGRDEIARFQREAKAVARLKHPNIVPIHDVNQEQGQHYLTMEYVGGGSLAQHLDRFANHPRAVAVLVEKVARAVHYAHEQNILHRDLKPANILLDESGEPRVSDFGLAKMLDAQPRSAASAREDLSEKPAPDLAETGLQTLGAIGTPAYMAPEQVTGGKLTPAADVWALGVILYQLLTGKLPFVAKTRPELATQILDAPPPALGLHRPGVDPELQAICLRCLEKTPANRYPSAEALANDLARWLRGGPLLQRPWRFARRRPLLAATILLLLGSSVVAITAAMWPADPDQPLHAVQKQLAQGKPVTLIGPTGPPAWFRWQGGEDRARIVLSDDDSFSISTQATAMLELLPDPENEGYRFSAEMRIWPGPVAHAGLYFGHSPIETPTGTLHFTAEWSLHDSYAVRQANFKLRCCKFSPSSKVPVKIPQPLVGHTEDGQAGQPFHWCTLALEIRPQDFRIFWQGQEVQPGMSRPELQEEFRKWTRERSRNLLESLGFTDNNPVPTFPARAGLGLYIEECTVSFRNVAIEPIVPKD
jgi:serine/threonine-protein kinase